MKLCRPSRRERLRPRTFFVLAKRTKRRACEAHEIKHESDVADDSSDVDAAPQNPRSVGSKPSTPGSSKPDPTSGGLLQEESDDDECQVIEHRQQPAQAQEAVRIRKCLNLFKAFPNAAGITMEELLKCWIRYALTESGDKILDCSTWLHSQSTVLEEDAFIFDRLFKLSPPAVMLQTICDKLVKCLHSAELRSGGAQATALPSQAFEPATVFAEASATRDANAAFDPVRYRSLDKSERVQMVKVHFPSAQKLFQYHATINNAISIKLASHDVQSPAHLFHETWSRLGADSKSEWEQLLFRLHKDGLKKPVGPAGQQLLEQQRAIAIVAAAIAGRSSPSPGANFSEAFTVHLDSHNAATRKREPQRKCV
ncbi:hypothetical protein HII31_13763 [Pseudocercospora fuligena]|uniref:Uncharacterized protein n=1 Tax=Pseudocercospora fuligena TaxID=685502 RepID=A0A8H6R6T8_9PEZI|nr:hypothetical protein HII31_13763 [Pseudocercospora fuligena]